MYSKDGLHFLDYSRSYSQYGVLRICTFDTFYHGYFPGAGIPFLFSFGCTTPFYSTFHSLRSDPHAFARRGGIPARFPACLLLPIAAGTDACRLLYAKPAVELPVMTLHAGLFACHWLLFAAQCQGCGWPADFMPALRGECACLCLADTSFRSPSLRVLLFHYCFWPKSQSFSAAKIVCGRERLDKP